MGDGVSCDSGLARPRAGEVDGFIDRPPVEGMITDSEYPVLADFDSAKDCAAWEAYMTDTGTFNFD